MRFLFTMHPAVGHFHSMVSLAQALKDCGHEVAFATGRSFGPVVTRTGFDEFTWDVDIVKDKRRGPGWSHSGPCRGPEGLH